MQKTLLAAALAAGLGISGGAYAADLTAGGSLKDAPVYAPEVSWTGFYLGAGGGGAATSSDLKALIGSFTLAEANGIGGVGGFGTVQVGYDRQFSRFVGGVFADYDFDSVDSKVSFFNGHLSFPFNLNDSWTVGGRLGYLVNPNTLAYALAGYTEATFDLPAGTHNSTFEGYTVGGGLETNLTGNLFLKLEYRFTGLDQNTIFTAKIWEGEEECYKLFKVTDQPDIQTGRLVLTYKFGADVTPLK